MNVFYLSLNIVIRDKYFTLWKGGVRRVSCGKHHFGSENLSISLASDQAGKAQILGKCQAYPSFQGRLEKGSQDIARDGGITSFIKRSMTLNDSRLN